MASSANGSKTTLELLDTAIQDLECRLGLKPGQQVPASGGGGGGSGNDNKKQQQQQKQKKAKNKGDNNNKKKEEGTIKDRVKLQCLTCTAFLSKSYSSLLPISLSSTTATQTTQTTQTFFYCYRYC